MKDIILVVGDCCTDEYVYGTCTRINPEAPTPVFVPSGRVKTSRGMAANVHANLQAMFPRFQSILVHSRNIDSVKRRYVDEKSKYIILRVDEEPKILNDDKFNHETIINNYGATRNLPKAIIISDYNKGYLHSKEIRSLAQFCKKYGILTFVDTKKDISSYYFGDVDYIKINEVEFNTNNKEFFEGYPPNHEVTLIKTLGDKGCDLYCHNGIYVKKNIPLDKKVDVFDVSGAGDTFLAAFAAYIVDNNIKKNDLDGVVKACKFANFAAGIAVSHSGVYVVNNEDIENGNFK